MPHLALDLLRPAQLLQPHHTPLAPNRTPSPIDRHPPLCRIDAQRREQLDVDVDVVRRAAHALVHDLDVLDRLAVGRVVDADGGAAEGVVVGVGGGESCVGDGDDGLAGRGGDVAGGFVGGGGGGVVGHVAGVGVGEGDGDGEGEGGESEGAGFHLWWL